MKELVRITNNSSKKERKKETKKEKGRVLSYQILKLRIKLLLFIQQWYQQTDDQRLLKPWFKREGCIIQRTYSLFQKKVRFLHIQKIKFPMD